jgi:hypothetical protein
MKFCGSQKGKLHLSSFLARQADILRRTLSLIEAAAGLWKYDENLQSGSHHFARFYNCFGHFLCRPHAVEVGEISTGLQFNSRLHHTCRLKSVQACAIVFKVKVGRIRRVFIELYVVNIPAEKASHGDGGVNSRI